MRSEVLSGSGGTGSGGAATGAAGSTGAGSAGGGGASGRVAQPATIVSNRMARAFVVLVTEADTQHVDLRSAQAASEHVEFIKVIGRPDTYAVISLVIDCHTLDI